MWSDLHLGHNNRHSLLKLITHKQLYVVMSLLNTPCKHSQCRVGKVCEPWFNSCSFGSNNLNRSCGSDLHGQDTFWTIRLYKTVSVILQYSWDVWCEPLSWGHDTASQSGWGQDSDWATPEGVLSSVLLLLIYFCVMGRCPVASPNFCWASIGGQIALHSPAKCLDKLGN